MLHLAMLIKVALGRIQTLCACSLVRAHLCMHVRVYVSVHVCFYMFSMSLCQSMFVRVILLVYVCKNLTERGMVGFM